MSKISVIVPVFQTGKYLNTCLESLVNQTINITNLEIIIINDASKDNSQEIIENFYQQYPDSIKVINHNKNQRQGKCRNEGIDMATGEYLAFIDSDDYIDLHMFEDYYDFAKKHKLDIVTGNYVKVYEKTGNHEKFTTSYFDITNVKKDPNLINKISYGPCNKIFKTSLVKDNNIKFAEDLKYEDFPFVFECVVNALKIGHIKGYYHYYLIRNNSDTMVVDQKIFDIFKIFDIITKNEYLLPKDEFVYFMINNVSLYMLKQRYQDNKKLRYKFFDEGYKYLNKFLNWQNNCYYLKINPCKRFIINHKAVMKCYCYWYLKLRIEDFKTIIIS